MVKSPVTLSTLPEGFDTNQVQLSSGEQQDTLTVALENTGIVPAPDAGIAEVCVCPLWVWQHNFDAVAVTSLNSS